MRIKKARNGQASQPQPPKKKNPYLIDQYGDTLRLGTKSYAAEEKRRKDYTKWVATESPRAVEAREAAKKAAPKKKMRNGGDITKANDGITKRRSVYRNPENTYKMVVKEKSGPRGEMKTTKETRTLKGVLKGVPKSSGVMDSRYRKSPLSELDMKRMQLNKEKSASPSLKARNGKQMIKRADGSYSQRGLWDNIRANRGSGKKPTAAMLKQERKIKSKK